LVLGSLSYGASLVLFIHAMRGMGAARTSALFSSAPLAGMILSFLLFQEFPSWMFVIAFPLLVAGTLFLVSEEHEHAHVHKMTIHEHAHIHDDGHHRHDHEGEYANKHDHVHKHDELIHIHHHMPDLHHRHIHPSES
jgi:ABC-type nickel/cobalt efflux system permease component RcnA